MSEAQPEQRDPSHLFGAHSATREDILSQFEDAWFAGDPPSIDQFLATTGVLDRVHLLVELVHVDLEFRVKRGDDVRVESYVTRYPELRKRPRELFGLVEAEFRFRKRRDATVSVDEYGARFPKLKTRQRKRLQEIAAEEEKSQSTGKDTALTWSGADALSRTDVPGRSDTERDQTDEQVRSTALISSKELLRSVVEKQLISREEADTCFQQLSKTQPASAKTVLEELVRRKRVTVWQLREIHDGRPTFFLENGRYLLLDEIGQGGMGAVYRARHTRMGRDVALKVIDPQRVRRPELVRRFHREIEVCSRLQHEHVVQAYDVGVDDGVTFLVLEYVKGSDLASLVARDGVMAPAEAAGICLQTAAGLAYAHRQGVVHRDIKPHNILLSTSGETKILDMGLARLEEDDDNPDGSGLTQQGEIMGTVDYMAPEQARNARQVDARCDVYSLGATLYFLLAGQPPYPGGSAIEKFHRLANEAPQALSQLRPDCPQELIQVVETMMAKSRKQRYQTAEDVVRALKPFAAEKIAGRAVVTASVQTAAETRYAATPSDDHAELPFVTDADASPLTMFQRRRAESKWHPAWLVGGLVAVLLFVAAALWLPGSRSSGETGGDPAEQKTDKNPGGSKTAVRAVPPAEYRVRFDGHPGFSTPGYVYHFVTIWQGTGRFAFFNGNNNVVLTPNYVLAWSPDGVRLATGGADGIVRVWSVVTDNRPSAISGQEQPRAFRHHHAAICSLAWSADGKQLVSGDVTGVIYVFSPDSDDEIVSLSRNPEYSKQIKMDAVFSPDGKELAYSNPRSGNRPAHIVRWNLKLKQPVWEQPGGGDMLWYSRDGKMLAAGDTVTYSSGTTTPKMHVWDLAGNRKLPEVKLPGKPVIPLGFDAGNQLVLLQGQPGAVVVWDCRAGRIRRSIPLNNPEFTPDINKNAIRGWLAADGKSCLLQLSDKSLRTVQLADGQIRSHGEQAKRQQSFVLATPNLNHWHPYPWGGRPDIALHRLSDGKEVKRIRVFHTTMKLLQDVSSGRFAVPQKNRNGAWDLHTGRWIREFPANAVMLADGSVRQVVRDGRVFSWPDVDSLYKQPTLLATLKDDRDYQRYFQLTGDGKLVWATTPDRKVIRFWQADTGEVIRTFELKPTKSTNVTAYTPIVNDDGRFVVAGFAHPDRRLAVWDNGKEISQFDGAINNSGSNRYTITPNGRFIAVHTERDRANVRIYDVATSKLKHTLRTNLKYMQRPVRLEFDSTGKYLLLTRQVWDVEAGEKIWECPERDHAVGGSTNFRFGAFLDGGKYALIGQDARYDVWDWRANGGKGRKVLSLHPLPEDAWVIINHVTGHYSKSPSAFKHIQLRYGQSWLSPIRYRRLTGWKSAPQKAGLQALPSD